MQQLPNFPFFINKLKSHWTELTSPENAASVFRPPSDTVIQKVYFSFFVFFRVFLPLSCITAIYGRPCNRQLSRALRLSGAVDNIGFSVSVSLSWAELRLIFMVMMIWLWIFSYEYGDRKKKYYYCFW